MSKKLAEYVKKLRDLSNKNKFLFKTIEVLKKHGTGHIFLNEYDRIHGLTINDIKDQLFDRGCSVDYYHVKPEYFSTYEPNTSNSPIKIKLVVNDFVDPDIYDAEYIEYYEYYKTIIDRILNLVDTKKEFSILLDSGYMDDLLKGLSYCGLSGTVTNKFIDPETIPKYDIVVTKK